MTHDPLEIRQLRYFLAVAEAGSFSRAADRLGLSQPSVSQQMRDLEAGLRQTLFQRRGKRILLTPAGMVFEEHARAMLRQLGNCLERLSPLTPGSGSQCRNSPLPISRRRWKKAGWTWALVSSPATRQTCVTILFGVTKSV